MYLCTYIVKYVMLSKMALKGDTILGGVDELLKVVLSMEGQRALGMHQKDLNLCSEGLTGL